MPTTLTLRGFLARILALLVSPLCLLTAYITENNANPPENQAPVVAYQNFGLFEAIPRYQGLTTDGESWYYSWNYGLQRTDLNHKILADNFIAVPLQFLLEGSNHIGGISYYDGKLYCPLEDGSDYLKPYILIYDAKTLKYTGEYYLLPQEYHVDGVPWVAVDGPRGVAYTAEWNNAQVLNVFSLEDFSLVKTVPLSSPLHRIQDAEVYNGVLWCGADTKDSHTIWAVNPGTGEVTKVFDRNLDNDVEAEGFTAWPMPDGSFFHCTETGASSLNVMFRHYARP